MLQIEYSISDLPRLYNEQLAHGITKKQIYTNISAMFGGKRHPTTIMRDLQRLGIVRSSAQKRADKLKDLRRDFDIAKCNRNVQEDKWKTEAIVLSFGRNNFGAPLDDYLRQLNEEEKKRLADSENRDINRMRKTLSAKESVLRRLEERHLPKNQC
jgi:hypothetical protein